MDAAKVNDELDIVKMKQEFGENYQEDIRKVENNEMNVELFWLWQSLY